jgi:lysophospholipase L1-like esterase
MNHPAMNHPAMMRLATLFTAILLGLPLAAQNISEAASPQHGGIVFVGSSIFAYWRHLPEQMAPLPVLNKGIPGTMTQDMLNRMGQLVLPYQPRIVVYYCGSNDVGSGADAAGIIQRTKRFIEQLHEKSPDTFFFYTSIQMAPDKHDRWDVVEAVNREMERYSHSVPNVGYIDMNSVLFDKQHKLREDLFLPDQLHFRPESSAYAEFSQIVKPVLARAWAEIVAKGSK